MKQITSYFDTAIQMNASDLHLVGGSVPFVRINGELQELEQAVLPSKELETEIYGLLSAEQKERFATDMELDFGYEQSGLRFRVNVHWQEESIGLAARLIPSTIPSADDLRFEEVLRELPHLLDGLVLVVGPTGHGKSTTLASMIDQINESRKAHIVTIEDPIEFMFQEKKSLIEQREVGTDTKSFANALKHVLRQDPDVILVGEMRDPETIATVLTAAETGHLVFSTLHTSSAAEAIERIVDVFDGAKQKQILIQLSAVLRAVVAQQLVPTVDGRRIAAREVMINTPAIANLIRENNIAQIPSVIQTNAKDGMIPMDTSMQLLAKQQLISDDVADRRMGRNRKI